MTFGYRNKSGILAAAEDKRIPLSRSFLAEQVLSLPATRTQGEPAQQNFSSDRIYG